MIVKSHEADRFAANPPKTLRAALVFGPDAGLVQERAEKLLKSVVADLTDPFNVADLNESTLVSDPARLSHRGRRDPCVPGGQPAARAGRSRLLRRRDVSRVPPGADRRIIPGR